MNYQVQFESWILDAIFIKTRKQDLSKQIRKVHYLFDENPTF